MKNILVNYFGQPIAKSDDKSVAELGPVVTISRECGCSANRIAIKLSKILTGYSYQSANSQMNPEWRWMNKEVIEAAAKELEMNPERIRGVFLSEAKSSINEVTTAFSTSKVYDADDQKVIDTVKKVITSLAEGGHCILVGRGANLLTGHISQKLNIKLQAPLEWRIKRIMQISNMNRHDAQEYVLGVDSERELFVEHVASRKLNNNDFDMIFNYSTMPDDYMVDAIVNVLKSKKIIVAP